jgi:hypothetical protein
MSAPITASFLREDIPWDALHQPYRDAQPFHHVVIEDFFTPQVASELSAEFPDYGDPVWRPYNNAIENKKLLNHWDKFGPLTYRVMSFLNSPEFVHNLKLLTGIPELEVDVGLNGGGWHAHSNEGKLNVHMDYSLHPKLLLERRLNLIVYLTEGWQPEWGGALELWSHDADRQAPKQCEAAIDCLFNRAVLFDTTMNSWHGLPEQLRCPDGVIRRSLAVYYLTPPRASASDRGKALFAPFGEQANDPSMVAGRMRPILDVA